jgi:signal transduction histidine kinase
MTNTMSNRSMEPGGDDTVPNEVRAAWARFADGGLIGGAIRTEPLHVGLLLTDADGFVSYADDWWNQLMGGLRCGELWTNAVALEDRCWVDAVWAECLRNQLTFCAEFRSSASHGRRWVRACAVHGLAAFGTDAPGWTWHFADCTLEYGLGELAMTLDLAGPGDRRVGAAARAIAAFQRASEGLAVICDGRVALCNSSWRVMHGGQLPLQSDRIVWELLYTEPDAARIREYLQRQPAPVSPWHAQVRSLRADGTTAAAVVELIPGTDGDVVLTETSARNSAETVRELRARNERLALAGERLAVANQALELANRRRNEFIATTIHELRTPLTAILGLAEAIEQPAFGSLNGRQRDFVHTIKASGRQLMGLIDDLLDLSRLEAGRLTLRYESVTLAELGRAVSSLGATLAPRHDVKVEVKIAQPGTAVQTDLARIRQIVTNLLSNAIRATPPGGVVGLKLAPDVPGQWRLSVWDTGCGMNADELAALTRYEPFTELPGRSSACGDGAGLGLFLVKNLTDHLRGVISVSSEPGRGTRFVLTFPATAPAEGSLEA